MTIKNISELIAEFIIDTFRLKYAMTHNEMVIKASIPINEKEIQTAITRRNERAYKMDS